MNAASHMRRRAPRPPSRRAPADTPARSGSAVPREATPPLNAEAVGERYQPSVRFALSGLKGSVSLWAGASAAELGGGRLARARAGHDHRQGFGAAQQRHGREPRPPQPPMSRVRIET